LAKFSTKKCQRLDFVLDCSLSFPSCAYFGFLVWRKS
jgi:hypothetical protein